MNMRQKKKRMKIKVLQGNPDDIVVIKYNSKIKPKELMSSAKALQKAFSPRKIIVVPEFIVSVEYNDTNRVISMCESIIKTLKG